MESSKGTGAYEHALVAASTSLKLHELPVLLVVPSCRFVSRSTGMARMPIIAARRKKRPSRLRQVERTYCQIACLTFKVCWSLIAVQHFPQCSQSLQQAWPMSLMEHCAENEQGTRELPSNAFCKALDNEEEYDANDALASGVTETKREKRPPRHMEVGCHPLPCGTRRSCVSQINLRGFISSFCCLTNQP